MHVRVAQVMTHTRAVQHRERGAPPGASPFITGFVMIYSLLDGNPAMTNGK